VQSKENNQIPAGEGLGVFMGSYTHSLDPKKRLTIPSEWRDHAGVPGSLYVLPGLEGMRYLMVFPAREMVQRLQSIRNLSIADAKGRQFARLLGSQSQLAPWDSAGRIRVNDSLLEHAQLSDQVVLVGAIDHFELWSPVLWKQAGLKASGDLGEAARYVGF
jgi:MraZ protein